MKSKKLMAVLITFVMLLSNIPFFAGAKAFAPSEATTYYVATNGNDGWSGKLDAPNSGGNDGPFKTIQKAADVAKAGDTVVIREGTYRETITPYNYGTEGAPITFKNYENERVTISGADVITGWKKDKGNIYKIEGISSIVSGIYSSDQVFIDGQMINLAQQPNNSLDQSHRIFQQFDSVLSDDGKKATIKDAELTQPDGYWNGAFIHFQPSPDYFNTLGRVTDYKKGQLTFEYTKTDGDKVSIYDPYGSGKVAFGKYYLFGHINALDSKGEWYLDSNTRTMYLRTLKDDDPNNHVIEMKKRDYGFILSEKSYINIKGLNFFACTITCSVYNDTLLSGFSHGEKAPAVKGIVIDGIHARYISHGIDLTNLHKKGRLTTGIILKGSDDVIKNSIIEYSSGNGILVYGERNKVLNNIIHDVNYDGIVRCAGISTGDEGVSMARDIEIGYNTLYTSGRSLIEIRSLTNGPLKQSRIHHNVMSDICLQTSDSGALYAYDKKSEGVEVDHNIVHNIHGFIAVGLYFDDRSDSYRVHHNLIFDADCAMDINGGANHKIYNNTFMNNGSSIVDAFPKTGEGEEIFNNILNGSVSVPDGAARADNIITPSGTQTFADAPNNNFHLKADSQAINAGRIIDGITNDTRPGSTPVTDGKPDVGCYEFGAGDWTAGATNLKEALPQLNLTALSSGEENSKPASDVDNITEPLTIKIGTKAVDFRGKFPEIKSGIICVYVKPLFEAMGFKYSVDSKTKYITLTKGTKTVKIKSGDKNLYINNNKYTCSPVPYTVSGGVYVPLEYIITRLGGKVAFDKIKNTYTVEITIK